MERASLMLVYHGSTVKVTHPVAAACRPNLDFGRGFYLTDIREQVEKWACRAANRDKQQWLNIYWIFFIPAILIGI